MICVGGQGYLTQGLGIWVEEEHLVGTDACL